MLTKKHVAHILNTTEEQIEFLLEFGWLKSLEVDDIMDYINKMPTGEPKRLASLAQFGESARLITERSEDRAL